MEAASPALMQQMSEIPYDQKFDPRPKDYFGPIKTNNTVQLPKTVNINFIGGQKDLDVLAKLIGAPMIGMDSEWRPVISPFDPMRPALLQLSSETDAYLIDLVALAGNKELDSILTQVFTHSDTLCIGFSFHSDLDMFEQFFPSMSFYKKFTNFIDVQSYYMKIHELDNQIGLAKVATDLMGKEICKGEQMSNWELRPLRKTQLHYGALDAYVLIELLKLTAKAAEKKGDIALAIKPNIEELTLEGYKQKKAQQKADREKKHQEKKKAN